MKLYYGLGTFLSVFFNVLFVLITIAGNVLLIKKDKAKLATMIGGGIVLISILVFIYDIVLKDMKNIMYYVAFVVYGIVLMIIDLTYATKNKRA